MSNEFKDLFSKQAADYSKFRPTYPVELYQYLTTLVKEHKLAVDLGTGNGQAALVLADYFDKVVAIDPSEKQIQQATQHPHIEYKVGTAESIAVADQSVDLITVAQAFHWFKHDIFFTEAKRILKPEGILALWVYNLCSIDPIIDSHIKDFYDNVVGPYWEPERRLLEQNFSTIAFPFAEIQGRSFRMEKRWSREDLLGYLSTWSALQTYRKKTGTDPLQELTQKLQLLWPTNDARAVKWTIYPRVFRNSVN